MDELSHFPDFFPVLTMFVNKTYGDYDKKIQLDIYLKFRRDKDYKWVFLYFVKLYVSV